ncbi:YcgL domain-containing protein [Endozoicomonadaceae bacterium StTr2]
MKKLLVSVFKSSKKEETYLFVQRGKDLNDIPENLRAVFGTPIQVMDMLLTPEKKLAQTDGAKVLEAIETHGFHLQLPPPKERELPELQEEMLRFNDPT